VSDLSLYRNIGDFKEYEPNDIVFLQKEMGDDMYLVVSGKFGVYINSFTDFPIRIAEITEGGFFGEMSAIDGWTRSATVICEENGSAVVVNHDNFHALLENIVDISAQLLTTLVQRAKSAIEMVRQRGEKVLTLPDEYIGLSPENPETDLVIMRDLAQRIRMCNESIGINEEVRFKNQILNATSNGGDAPVTILPEWVKKYRENKANLSSDCNTQNDEKVDQNNNKGILIDQNYTCPFCEEDFKGKLPLFTQLSEKEKMNDGRVIYHNFNMLFYTNVICPNCNYCDTYQEFQYNPQNQNEVNLREVLDSTKIGSITEVAFPELKEDTFTPDITYFQNIEKFTGFSDDYKRTLDETELSCYLNLYCLKQIINSEFRQAKAWHRLYWLYSDFGEVKLANEAAKQALIYYTAYHVQNKDRLAPADLEMLKQVIDELSKKS